MNKELTNIIDGKTCLVLIISALSGIANYLYKQSKGEKWNSKMFFINTSLAIFVGYGASILLPDTEYEKVFIMIVAFLARDILGILEIYLPKIIERQLEKDYLDNERIGKN